MISPMDTHEGLTSEFPDEESELAFLEFLTVDWPGWQNHVGSDHWHISRRAFLAGRAAPPSPELPAVGLKKSGEYCEHGELAHCTICHMWESLPLRAPAPHAEVREALEDAAEWCTVQGSEIGAVDGYDYRSGEEYGLRRASIELARRAKAVPQSERGELG